MKMLITGGAGFIGSNFIFYMRKKHPSYRLICLDKLTYAANPKTLEPVMDCMNFRFFQADITDCQMVDRVFQEEHPDVVVHFAAESHVDRSIEDPSLFLQTNVMGTQVLLEGCRRYGINRFHLVSTDEVYGDLPLESPELRFTEASHLRPSSPYAASKAAADLLCGAYYRTYGLPVTVSRCSNNYGPYQSADKLIPRMIVYALQDRPLPVYGNGQNVRDWLYVEDHCAAIDRILQHGIPGRFYNIGGENEMKNIDIVKCILKLLHKSESLIAYTEDRKGHDLRYAVDPTLLCETTGWAPLTDFESGLRKTVQWYQENLKWWEMTR